MLPRTFSGPDFPALMTFNQGGTLNAYAIPPNGTTPALTSPEYGVFNRERAPGNFWFRDIGYGYDSDGAFTGSSIISATGNLAADGNSFTYDATGVSATPTAICSSPSAVWRPRPGFK